MSEKFDPSRTEYLSIPMAAQVLGLSNQRVHQLVKQGRLAGQIIIANRWCIPSPPEVLPPAHRRGRPYKIAHKIELPKATPQA